MKGGNIKVGNIKIDKWETFSTALLMIVSFFLGLLIGIGAR
ncbi:Uncharacterised protein [uncultured archaeon]|nr:Uncharacterised protein [uncultured archaeon]